MKNQKSKPGELVAETTALRLTAKEVSARLQKIQILIVVSSQSAADLIKNMFLELGFSTIFTALNTTESIAVMRQVRTDLIVTDCEIKPGASDIELEKIHAPSNAMATLNGIDFVQRLRHSPSSPNPFIPVVMLVNNANGQLVLSARDAGVNEVIIKPMNAPDFCARMVAIVDKPRNFVTASTYKGPCRRRKRGQAPNKKERRTREIRVLRNEQLKQP